MVMGSLDINTEVLVIGGGPGGYVAAIRAAQLGKEVVIVEKGKKLGGVCLNTGCIPTKALIHASSIYSSLKEYSSFGVEIKDYDLNVEKMNDWKNNIVDKLNNGILSLCKKHGVEIIEGTAILVSNQSIRVEGKTDVTSVNFKHCIIATGSSAIEIPGFAFDEKIVVNSDVALSLNTLPKNLVIIGGGYIGTEMGTIYGKLGSNVHIIEVADSIIPTLDKEITRVVANKLESFNVKTHLNSKAVGYVEREGKIYVQVNDENNLIEADMILVVVGRKPNSNGLGLESVGVQVDDKGCVVVDETMRTNVNNIYAVGDVAGQPMLAHKASRQGKVAAEVICGLPSAFDNKVIPFVVFNDPEICSVGLTESQAKEQGHDISVGKFPFSALGRALTLNKSEGFVKFIAEKDTGLILGMQAVGAGASDIVSEAVLAIEMSATLEDIASIIHPHPTLPESLMEAAEVTLGKGIHIFNPKN